MYTEPIVLSEKNIKATYWFQNSLSLFLKAKQIIKILYMLLSISMENIFALNSIIDYSNNVKNK